MNYFVAVSFCHEGFYSSTVIERHLCQTLHSSSVKEEYRASPFLVCLL